MRNYTISYEYEAAPEAGRVFTLVATHQQAEQVIYSARQRHGDSLLRLTVLEESEDEAGCIISQRDITSDFAWRLQH